LNRNGRIKPGHDDEVGHTERKRASVCFRKTGKTQAVRLLVTRPAPDGERTEAALQRLGHAVILAPLLRIETVADADIGTGPFAGLAITSRNAISALGEQQRRDLAALPVFAVGDRSAESARAFGFADVVSAGRDVAALARVIATRLPASRPPLLYLAGEDRAGDLADTLAAHGIPVHIVVAYRALMADALPEAAVQALAAGKIDGVLHFSRRSAEAYLACCRRAGLGAAALAPQQYCLSAQVAEPLMGGAAKIRIAERPEEPALLELLVS
jgi:uroporphyrinogen-III synthase